MNIQDALKKYPKENLTTKPTPLQYLQHLSNKIGVNVYIKRDDLTDLALGGDKPRKMEYEIETAELRTCFPSSTFKKLKVHPHIQ